MRLIAKTACTLILSAQFLLADKVTAQQAPNTSGWAVVNPPTPTRRYGMAGCGLGSVLLPQGPQTVVSFLNGLAWNQLFMISSGTSNCQSENSRQVMLEQEHYITHNYRDLAREASQGQGPVLAGLADSLGCRSADVDHFGKFAQRNYKIIFSQPGALAALESLKKQINLDNQLNTSCALAASTQERDLAR